MFRISTGFESGNIGAWAADGPRRLRFAAPTDGAPWAMWFYFRLDDAGAGPFEFVVTNLVQCLEATHWGDVRPVMRTPGGEWVRAGGDDVVLDLEVGEFRFRFELPGGPVEVAYCHPYPRSRLEALVHDLVQHPGVEASHPGQSAQGRPVPYLVMRCTDPYHRADIIWANSREHAGEVSGAYVLEGFLRAAATSPLRERYEIHALPMVDIDAVVEGRYGKVAPPVDHYMCWCPDTPRPEVALAMRLMKASVVGGRRFRLFLDFHSPSPENDSYLPPINPTLLTSEQRANAERLCNAIVTHSPAEFAYTADTMAYQRVAAWFADDAEHRPEAFVLRQFGAEACLIETAYHASATGTVATPELWCRVGASIVRALERYLLSDSPGRIGVYDSMPPVFSQNHGWILWTVPHHTRLTFTKHQALAVADAPSAQAYFGAPRLYRLDEVDRVCFHYRGGGEAHLVWCCYDSAGARLLAMPQAQKIEPMAVSQPLRLPEHLPKRTCQIRPGFRLSGSFRSLQVEAR